MGEVSTIEFFPLAWVLHFARAILCFNVINAVTKRKYSLPLTFTVFVGICMLYSYLTLQLNDKTQKTEYACLLIYFAIQFVLVLFLTEGKLFVKLSSIVFSFLTMTLSTILYFSSFSYLLGRDYSDSFANSLSVLSLLTASAFMIVFSFLIAFIIEFIKTKLKRNLNHNIKYMYFYLFPLTHFLGLQLIYVSQQLFYQKNNYYPERVSKICCIYYAFCFAIDISIIFAVDFLEKKEQENKKNKDLIAKNELDYQQFMILKSEKEKFSKIRHDISNILTVATGFLEIDKPEKALEFIQNANKDIHLSANKEICENEVINTIYTIKQQEAQENGVTLNVKVTEKAPINILDYDLCRIMTNLIDNQINALKNTDYCLAELTIVSTSSEVFFKGVNPYTQKKTVKRNTSEHGYGQKIISATANKYGGAYKSEITNNQFVTNVSLQNKTLTN